MAAIRTLLIANRGEIACRVIRTARAMGIKTVAVYSDADAEAMHVHMADEAVRLGPAPAAESYLKADLILDAAKRTGADAIHPGYGFLSENAAFAEACEGAGVIFVGPPAGAITAMGLKDGAKRLMEQAGVPVVPGYHGDNQDPEHLAGEAERIGYPVLIKAVAGGGGKGMRRVDAAEEFSAALEGAKREAKAAFGDERVLVEKYVLSPRHIEIQVFADAHGNVVYLFERDCSLQRRHQKVVEEAPAPGMPEEMRKAMGEAACNAARAIGYRGAGTVEFIADGRDGLQADKFFFMEMNTRLQVEHPVTEMITGCDLVEWQLRVAAGEPLPLSQDELEIDGHAFEVRLYAENPRKKFLPSTGTLHRLRLPLDDGRVRVDTGVREGDAVTMFYDPMIAKIIVWDEDRRAALSRLHRTLQDCEVAGVQTNLAFLAEVADHPAFREAAIDTGFIDRHLEDLVPAGEELPGEIKAAAALWVLADRREQAAAAALASGDPFSPWHAVDGFRLLDQAAETIRFGGDAPFEVQVRHSGETYALRIGEHVFEAAGELDAEGGLIMRLDGHRKRVAVTRLSDPAGAHRLLLSLGGKAYETRLHDALRAAEMEDETGGSAVLAPMPGKIVSVHTEVGARVKKGQALVVLEAMKMEHTLAAPRDAVVASLSAGAGDQVDEGAAVVTFEADG